MTWTLFSSRRQRLGKRTDSLSSRGRFQTIRLRMVLLCMVALMTLAFFPSDESNQFLPYSLEEFQQSNPFGLSNKSLIKAFSSSASTNNNNKMNLLLYITTHFSDQHLRYFHCCWPKLVQESPLVSSAHILVVASNHTPVDPKELAYLSSTLFHENPSYQIQFLSHYPNPCQKFRKEVPKGSSSNQLQYQNPLKVPVNYKQCMANFGVRAGFEHGWVHANIASTNGFLFFDWMIRINPDVLIRKSKWLLETMEASVNAIPTVSLHSIQNINTNTTMAIGVYCATRQLHTDFLALRPHHWNATAFAKMGRKGNKWNHERTAYQEMAHLIASRGGAIEYLPDVDPSNGSCRVRGENASVYHVHDSCQEDNMVCSALDGCDLRQ